MPINPFVDYKAPELYLHGMDNLGAGINQFGSNLFDQYQKEKEKRQKEQREKAYDDQIMQYAIQQDKIAQQTGQPRLLSDEAIHNYQMGGRKQQQEVTTGIVHGFIDKMNLMTQQQHQQQATQLHNIQMTGKGLENQLFQRQLADYGKPIFGQPTQEGTTGEGLPIMRPQQIGQYGASGPSYFPQRDLQPQMATQPPPVWKVPNPTGEGDIVIMQTGPNKFTQIKPQEGLDLDKIPAAPPGLWDRIKNVFSPSGTQGQPSQGQGSQVQAKSKYTPQQIALAKRAIADPRATPKNKQDAQAILADVAAQ